MLILLIAQPEFKFFGQFRTRYESRNNRDFLADNPDAVSFLNMRTRFGVKVKVNENLFFKATLQDSRIYGSTGAAVSSDNPLEGIGYTATNARGLESTDLIEAFAGLKYGPASLLIGRQRFAYDEHRLVGTFDWSNVGNSYDAVRGVLDFGLLKAEGFAAVLRNSQVAEGPVELPTGSDVSSNLYGLHTTVKLKGENYGFSASPYVFILDDRARSSAGGIGYPERRVIDTVIDWGGGWVDTLWKAADPQPAKIYSPGLHLKGSLKAGPIKPFFAGEFTYQTGNAWAYNISAFAGFGRLGVKLVPQEGVFLSLFLEYDMASGRDTFLDVRKDSVRRTPYNFFPTNHVHYGYGDLFSWKNLKALRINLSGGYGPVVLKLDYWNFSLYSKYDNWYHAGQGIFFSPTSAYHPDTLAKLSSSAGNEIDLTVILKFSKRARLMGGLSYFSPGEIIRRYYSNDPNLKISAMRWFFTQFVINF